MDDDEDTPLHSYEDDDTPLHSYDEPLTNA
jgi:hypothetical protein